MARSYSQKCSLRRGWGASLLGEECTASWISGNLLPRVEKRPNSILNCPSGPQTTKQSPRQPPGGGAGVSPGGSPWGVHRGSPRGSLWGSPGQLPGCLQGFPGATISKSGGRLHKSSFVLDQSPHCLHGGLFLKGPHPDSVQPPPP